MKEVHPNKIDKIIEETLGVWTGDLAEDIYFMMDKVIGLIKEEIKSLSVVGFKVPPENKLIANQCLELAYQRIQETEVDLDVEEVSLCEKCYCVTHTVDGKCGKCKEEKNG